MSGLCNRGSTVVYKYRSCINFISVACDLSELRIENSMFGTTSGANVDFECGDGFLPSEPIIFICRDNGEWNPDPAFVECTRGNYAVKIAGLA